MASASPPETQECAIHDSPGFCTGVNALTVAWHLLFGVSDHRRYSVLHSLSALPGSNQNDRSQDLAINFR